MIMQLSHSRSSCFRIFLMALGVVLCAGMSRPAMAEAPLCVNTTGTSGCYSTIQAAVAAAKPSDTILVAPGTYDEDVMISHPVTLIGASPSTTIINASGLSNGIYVDGRDNPGLSAVVVSGFTVENAGHEGILVTNATAIVVQNNIVMDNDKDLQAGPPPSCTDLPSFEVPGENMDCGEGIHLLAVNHSSVAGNTVQNNAGGILLSDETGPTFDNLVASNTVKDNIADCGITLASHHVHTGIYDNTIADNLSTGNGLNGKGAGVGLFCPFPYTRVSGNVVSGNRLISNGGPGVALHSHAPYQDLNDNVITANQISGNGADNPGAPSANETAGINVYGVSNITGTVISHNVISNEEADIVVNTNARVDANLNDLLGGNNGAYGVFNNGSGSVDARRNWWGCTSGPNTGDCSSVTGPHVFFVPWLQTPLP